MRGRRPDLRGAVLTMETTVLDLTQFPRTDYPATDVRGWFTDEERDLYDALCCRDLVVTITVGVCLHEHQEAKKAGKRPSRRKLTPEQDERERAASAMVLDRSEAMACVGRLFRLVASMRSEIAKLAAKGKTGPEYTVAMLGSVDDVDGPCVVLKGDIEAVRAAPLYERVRLVRVS